MCSLSCIFSFLGHSIYCHKIVLTKLIVCFPCSFSSTYPSSYDIEFSFPGKACGLDYGPRGRSHSRNASSESQSPGLSGSSNSAVGISESSSVTIQESECKNESLDKTGTELRGTFRHKKKRKTQVRGSMHPASLDLQTPKQLDDDDDDPLLSSMLAKKYEKNSDEASKGGGSRREKRLRRPTQRYIEEVSDKKSKHHKGERKFTSIDVAGIKDRQLKVRSHAELNSIGPGMLSSVPEEELLNGTKIQVVSETRPRRGRPKKQVSIVVRKFIFFYIFLCTLFLFLFYFLANNYNNDVCVAPKF